MNEQTFSAAGSCSAAPLPAAARDVDIVARTNSYEVITDLKGASEDNVVIGVLDHVLTVGSKVATETCRDIENFLVVDHRERLIEQSFALPNDADEDDVCLNFAGGKLKVIIGRRARGGESPLPVPPSAIGGNP